jgi:two-component sensor histidine kinase
MKIFVPVNKDKQVPLFTRVLASKNGEIFLSDRSGLIYTIDKNDSLYKWKEADQTKYNNGLYESPDGDIWMTDQGIGLMQYRYDKNGKLGLVKNISEKDGLLNQNIHSMVFDSLKRIWITSAMGLDILQKNYKGDWEVFNYSQDADLQVNWNQSKLITDAKGNIWLTSWHKLVKFDCHQLELKKETPKVVIEKVQLNLDDVDWGRYTDSLYGYQQLPVNPTLNYKKNTISFFFNGISFSSSPRLEYSYQLSPVEKSWSQSVNNASISFVNLSPGRYIFKVRTRDQGSAWSLPAEFSFAIIAPFWMRWWFIAICGLTAFAIIYSIYKYRINQVKKILFMRTKIARDLHDEVGSTLTSINILSKVSQGNLEKDKSRASELLQKITEQSANMQQSMSDIVWSIRPDNDKLENLVIRMREYLGQTAEPKNLLVEFFADEKILKESLTMPQRQNIFLIYKEAINNAVKYARCKRISVFLGKENNHIKLLIEDDGLGFDPGRVTSSSGLKNMRDRAKELKGSLIINSSREEGTKVELRCPAT